MVEKKRLIFCIGVLACWDSENRERGKIGRIVGLKSGRYIQMQLEIKS
jgi:hypothetical protein